MVLLIIDCEVKENFIVCVTEISVMNGSRRQHRFNFPIGRNFYIEIVNGAGELDSMINCVFQLDEPNFVFVDRTLVSPDLCNDYYRAELQLTSEYLDCNWTHIVVHHIDYPTNGTFIESDSRNEHLSPLNSNSESDEDSEEEIFVD